MNHQRALAAAGRMTGIIDGSTRVWVTWKALPEAEKKRLTAGMAGVAESWPKIGVTEAPESDMASSAADMGSGSDDWPKEGSLEIMTYLAGEYPAFGEAWSVGDGLKAHMLIVFSNLLRMAEEGRFDSRTEPIAQEGKSLPTLNAPIPANLTGACTDES